MLFCDETFKRAFVTWIESHMMNGSTA